MGERKLDKKALVELALRLGISEDADLVEETKKRWLRKPSQERWEVGELSLEEKEFVIKWAENEGLYSFWKPKLKNYDQALILGATTSPMRKRVQTLAESWEEGIRFKEVVWLTGERPLDPRVDSPLGTTESEAARITGTRPFCLKQSKSCPFISSWCQ